MPEPAIFRALGERALRVELGPGLSPAVAERVHALMRALDALRLPGLVDLVPGFGSLTVVYDPLATDGPVVEETARSCLEHGLAATPPGRVWDVPVVYGGARGPDLPAVAGERGLHPDDVVRLHTRTEYRVYAIGFMPGFPYLGVLPEELATPRLATPRPAVPSGSVGVAGRQTGIYPASSPGGWRILGWTPLRLFDPTQSPPALFEAGDGVRFRAVSETEAAAWRPERSWR